MTGPIVTAAWLRAALERPDVRVVDCRYRLGEPGAGEQLWREGHIPGAAFLDVDRDLAAPPGERGRHPLPSAERFEVAARRAGIGAGTLVIAYDEAGEGGAARLWWLLRHFGHEEVAVLDGGLRGWREAGGALRAGPEEVEPGDFQARPRERDTASAEELGRAPDAGEPGSSVHAGPPTLLDARAPERYRGEVEPVDPVAGHIPGAVNLPFAELAPGGRFLPAGELRARFEAAARHGGGDFVAYCGSGITACVVVLAAEITGLDPVRLYPGSWSEWSGRGLPVELGDSSARQ
jgi:thiosulfate/3-mercaptopyruvate sulfurtransferase